MKFSRIAEKTEEHFEEISPIAVRPTSTSITVGLSRRFLLFRLLEKLQRKIEDNPDLNFISNLRSLKLLGEVLTGTLHELHRDRNNVYFRNFFIEPTLHKLVKQDLEWVYAIAKQREDDIKITITKRGVIVYNNYKENVFNVLLITEHSGSWVRRDIAARQLLTAADRALEEDVGIQRVYGRIILERGGIWIDNKASRFLCDFNRPRSRAIYENGSEEWITRLWRSPLTKKQREWILEGYDAFYHTLASTIKSYHFNIIFDGHSMKDLPGRASISIGTEHIPQFYKPIARAMLAKLRKQGYKDADLDKPFTGGEVLGWVKAKFPDRFIFFLEVNKKLYMTKNRRTIKPRAVEKLAKDLTGIFDIEEPDQAGYAASTSLA